MIRHPSMMKDKNIKTLCEFFYCSTRNTIQNIKYFFLTEENNGINLVEIQEEQNSLEVWEQSDPMKDQLQGQGHLQGVKKYLLIFHCCKFCPMPFTISVQKISLKLVCSPMQKGKKVLSQTSLRSVNQSSLCVSLYTICIPCIPSWCASFRLSLILGRPKLDTRLQMKLYKY